MKLLSLPSLCRSAVIVFSVIFISSISTKAFAADITVSAPLNGTTVPSSFSFTGIGPDLPRTEHRQYGLFF